MFQAKNGNYTDEEIEQIQTITSKISSVCDGVTVDKVLTAFAALVSAMRNEVTILSRHRSLPDTEFQITTLHEITAAQAKTDDIASKLLMDQQGTK